MIIKIKKQKKLQFEQKTLLKRMKKYSYLDRIIPQLSLNYRRFIARKIQKLIVDKQFTCTFSNLGMVKDNNIKSMHFGLTPGRINGLSVSMITCNEEIIIESRSLYKGRAFEITLFQLLQGV